MTNTAAVTRARFGLIFLSILALFGLTACASDDVASTKSAASGSLVSPRVGMIDRDPVIAPGLQAPTTPTPPTTTTPPPTATVNPTTGTQQPGPPPVKVADGSATLDWTPPTQNSDGTTLTNLAGYTVYYGTSPDQLTQSVKVSNPGLTAYTVSNLAAGTWYFAVTSYSSSGVESSRTGVVSTTI
jgi:hypothetical protein